LDYWGPGVFRFLGFPGFTALRFEFASAERVYVFRNETYAGPYVKKCEVQEEYLLLHSRISAFSTDITFDFDPCSSV
jgi:hypothetical protein